MTGRLLEIRDKDIKECMDKTNKWYVLCNIIKDHIGLSDYTLWIGKLQWGDNEKKDIVAHYHNGEIYFQRGYEKSYDLVSMIIYSWWCNEEIDLELNNSIESTFKLLEKHSTIFQDDIDDLLFTSPYWYHDGKVK